MLLYFKKIYIYIYIKYALVISLNFCFKIIKGKNLKEKRTEIIFTMESYQKILNNPNIQN